MRSVWLVSCGCGFHSVCALMDEDKRLVEASWWEGLAVGKLGLAVVGKAMLSKFLIQFSTDGCGCVPSLSLLFSDFLWQRLTQARWGSEWRRKCFVNHNIFWVDNCTLNRDGTVVLEPPFSHSMTSPEVGHKSSLTPDFCYCQIL